jgi:hypothetical protein
VTHAETTAEALPAEAPDEEPIGDGDAPPPGAAACELKFVVPDATVAPLLAWARAHLPSGAGIPEAAPFLVHGLHFDTDALDVYHRSPGYRRSRYRVRRYGHDALLFLEKKAKTRGRVREQKTPVPEDELGRLAAPEPEPGWAGEWFRRRVHAKGLAPRCRIAFERLEYAGNAAGAPARLILDRNLRCARAAGLEMDAPPDGGDEWLPIEGVHLELKFRDALPRVFKELVREFMLRPTASSKYRQAVLRCDLSGGAA